VVAVLSGKVFGGVPEESRDLDGIKAPVPVPALVSIPEKPRFTVFATLTGPELVEGGLLIGWLIFPCSSIGLITPPHAGHSTVGTNCSSSPMLLHDSHLYV